MAKPCLADGFTLIACPMPSIKPGSTLLKYVVGIDAAKSSFVACLGRLDLSQQLSFSKEGTFDNTLSGFTALLIWVGK